jgi:hypothetical protein
MRCDEIDAHIIAVDALLIDCDGVLVDSHDAAATAWNSWARRWSPSFDFHRDIEHGRRITDVVAELVDPHDVDEAAADLIQAELIHAAEVPALPGARDLLNTSPPGTWAVVTSGGRAIATARMKAAGLPPADSPPQTPTCSVPNVCARHRSNAPPSKTPQRKSPQPAPQVSAPSSESAPRRTPPRCRCPWPICAGCVSTVTS